MKLAAIFLASSVLLSLLPIHLSQGSSYQSTEITIFLIDLRLTKNSSFRWWIRWSCWGEKAVVPIKTTSVQRFMLRRWRTKMS